MRDVDLPSRPRNAGLQLGAQQFGEREIMSSDNNDAATNAMSPRQIIDVLIMLLEHAAQNELDGLEINLGNSLEALMADINRKERERPPSQPNCASNLVDFSAARRRLLLDGRAAARLRIIGPTQTTWS